MRPLLRFVPCSLYCTDSTVDNWSIVRNLSAVLKSAAARAVYAACLVRGVTRCSLRQTPLASCCLFVFINEWITSRRKHDEVICFGRKLVDCSQFDASQEVGSILTSELSRYKVDIAPFREKYLPQKRLGMARVFKGYHSFTCHPFVYP